MILHHCRFFTNTSPSERNIVPSSVVCHLVACDSVLNVLRHDRATTSRHIHGDHCRLGGLVGFRWQGADRWRGWDDGGPTLGNPVEPEPSHERNPRCEYSFVVGVLWFVDDFYLGLDGESACVVVVVVVIVWVHDRD